MHVRKRALLFMITAMTVAAAACPAQAVPSKYKPNIGYYGMVPIHAQDIEDGTYPITAESNSVYFRIPEATLTVDGDEMSVTFVIESTSYLAVYPGTGAQAREAGEDSWIQAEVREDGDSVTFTIPVDGLDTAIPCAALSKKKNSWYDRDLLFYASSLPEEALKIDLPDYELIEEGLKRYSYPNLYGASDETEEETEAVTEAQTEVLTAVDTDLTDGEYSIEVAMTGGSGRASVSSPTYLTVRDGKAYAKLIWSSANYDYMIMGGTKYLNETTDGGNSTFTIPIPAMDAPVPIIADTTAMGDPLEIQYSLTFYRSSIGSRSQVPQEAAKRVLIMGAVIIILGGILNHLIKKKRQR